MRHGYVELLLGAAFIWLAAKIADRFVQAVWTYLQVDGSPTSRGRSTPSAVVDPPSTPTTDPGWGPFAVDPSNGSLPHLLGSFGPSPVVDEDEHRRLSGLVEFHRVPEGIVPPKSRPMRRTIH